jgi:hypothetical protein
VLDRAPRVEGSDDDRERASPTWHQRPDSRCDSPYDTSEAGDRVEQKGAISTVQHTSAALIAAVAFTWLGMVVAISFIETPLKFRARGVTVLIGLGIGRLVFRALNTVETALAVCLLVAVFLGQPTTPMTALALVAVLILVIQLAAIRPRLNRRTDLVLDADEGQELPRSRAHLAYIAAESLKVVTLPVLGIAALAA